MGCCKISTPRDLLGEDHLLFSYFVQNIFISVYSTTVPVGGAVTVCIGLCMVLSRMKQLVLVCYKWQRFEEHTMGVYGNIYRTLAKIRVHIFRRGAREQDPGVRNKY